MKKFVFFTFCLIWSVSVHSQTYYPLIEENKTWNVLAVGLTGPHPWDTILSTVSYKISGDTIVNSLTYKKVYSTWEEVPVNWNLWCLMREDAERKVWMRYKSEGAEFLMYDFLVETGDSVLVGEEPVYLYVDTITTVEINGTLRAKYWLSCKIMPDYYETWTVGVGSNRGLVWSGSAFLVGGWYWLLCMTEGDELIYMNPYYNSCYIISTGMDENKTENIRIFPNPASTTLRILGNEELSVSSIVLLDLTGRKVREFAPESRELDLSGSNKGLYILRISIENKEITKKILIE